MPPARCCSTTRPPRISPADFIASRLHDLADCRGLTLSLRITEGEKQNKTKPNKRNSYVQLNQKQNRPARWIEQENKNRNACARHCRNRNSGRARRLGRTT